MKKFPLIPLIFLLFLPIFSTLLLGEVPAENPFSLEEPIPNEPLDNTRFMKEFAYMLFMLGILITMVYFTAWFLRRMTNVRVEQLNASSNIRVLEKRALSQRTTLFLLEIDAKQILVAETPTTVVQLQLEKEI